METCNLTQGEVGVAALYLFIFYCFVLVCFFLLFLLFVWLVFDTGYHHVAQASLKLVSLLPQPPKCQ
jgi:hypothetical protein